MLSVLSVLQASCGLLRVPGLWPIRGGAFLHAVPCPHGAHQAGQHPRSE